MTISNFCVCFVVFIGLLVITGIIGWFFMWATDEENPIVIYCILFQPEEYLPQLHHS